MTKKKPKSDTITISKSKLKIVGIVIGIICIFLICFLVSSSNSEEYKSSNTTENQEEETLASITKEAGEVKDDERTAANEITLDEYLELYQKEEESLVLFSRPTCEYCKLATPIIENIIYQYDVEINYLNTGNLSQDDQSRLQESDEYFKEGYGTPLMLVVGNGKIVDYIDGLVGRNNYISFFKEYGFMK